MSSIGNSVSSLNSKKVFRSLTLRLDGDDDKLAASASLNRMPEGSAVDEFDRFSIIDEPEPELVIRYDEECISQLTEDSRRPASRFFREKRRQNPPSRDNVYSCALNHLTQLVCCGTVDESLMYPKSQIREL